MYPCCVNICALNVTHFVWITYSLHFLLALIIIQSYMITLTFIVTLKQIFSGWLWIEVVQNEIAFVSNLNLFYFYIKRYLTNASICIWLHSKEMKDLFLALCFLFFLVLDRHFYVNIHLQNLVTLWRFGDLKGLASL